MVPNSISKPCLQKRIFSTGKNRDNYEEKHAAQTCIDFFVWACHITSSVWCSTLHKTVQCVHCTKGQLMRHTSALCVSEIWTLWTFNLLMLLLLDKFFECIMSIYKCSGLIIMFVFILLSCIRHYSCSGQFGIKARLKLNSYSNARVLFIALWWAVAFSFRLKRHC